ncbi:uncharacterized protein LOC117329801 isoform X2 [Pecten maximus]|uniref:uncharacterized protein LOC117329801 isoform X2 n=1 Tax=Pecten maximus TaxID=6579 RepID=UPI0014582782|nr:uncharacterized protein LOC117329801 isoform X2 [Pecten maximus]
MTRDMHIHHIFVWASYFIAFLNGSVGDKKSWDKAVEYCKTTYNGTLSSLGEIENSSYTIQENVWARSSKLTQWLSIQGCYNIRHQIWKKKGGLIFDRDAVAKWCSEGCKTTFIASKGRRCVCLSQGPEEKIDWQDCHPPKNKSFYIVYKKYRNSDLPKESKSNSNLSDPKLNCGAVACNRTGYFQSQNCLDKFRFRCAETRSVNNMNWKQGKRHCVKSEPQPPQSFEKYCQKESDGIFRENDTGTFWIGMFRPVNHEEQPFEECTYLTENQTELVNCSLELRFFCTGAGRVHFPQQNPQPPTSTIKPRRKRQVLIGVIVMLFLLFVAIVVVMVNLQKRIKRNKQHIISQKERQTREQSAKAQQPDESLQPNKRGKDVEEIYEFEEIKDDEDSQMSSRNFAVKCPLPPEKLNSATGSRASGIKAAANNYSPINCILDQKDDAFVETSNEAEPGSQRHGIDDPASYELVEHNYDSFNCSKEDNLKETDIYDHAKIVTVQSRKPTMVRNNPECIVSEVSAHQQDDQYRLDGIYELAKGVENEYDELGTKIDRVVCSDMYDHVT